MVEKHKGPGKANRKGITLIDAVQKFGSEADAEAWFIERRWKDGIRCPHCNSVHISERASRKPMPYHCRTCRQYFSVRTGTVLQNSKLPLSKWCIAFYLFSTNLKGVSSMKLHRDLGITQKSAWHMAHRIREAWLGSQLTRVVTQPLVRQEVRAWRVPGHRKEAPAGSPVGPPVAWPRATRAVDTDFRSIRRQHPRTPGRSAAWCR